MGQLDPSRGASDDFAGQFVRLIEHPFPETAGMQGNGHDPPRFLPEPIISPDFVEEDSEKAAEMALLPVFELMHEVFRNTAATVGAHRKVDRQFPISTIGTTKGGSGFQFEPLPTDGTVVRADGDEGLFAVFAEERSDNLASCV